jgi:hypothetical protein
VNIICGIVAIIAFVIALILNVVGGKDGSLAHVIDATLVGFIFVVLGMLTGGWRPWVRTTTTR